MVEIKALKFREVIDSRGMPTVEAEITTDRGLFRGIAPSGTSAGVREPKEKREGLRIGRFLEINQRRLKEVVGKDWTPVDLDAYLMKRLETLGTNFTTALSIAIWKTADLRPAGVPRPMFNLINGGKHGGYLRVQEIMFVPKDFKRGIWEAVTLFNTIRKALPRVCYGLEGGFVYPFKSEEEAISFLLKSMDQAGVDGDISMDFAYESMGLNEEKALKLAEHLIDEFSPLSIEDPVESADALLKLHGRTLLVGDDLTVTNAEYIRKQKDLIDAVILKINQAGTVSALINAFEEAKKWDLKTIISHRSGDTEDSFLALLSAYLKSDFIKSGAPSRGERTAKYNELIRISEML